MQNLVGGNLETLVGVLLILVAVFICLQLGTMIVLMTAVRKMGGNLDRMRAMVEQQGTPAIKELREVLGEVKDILRSVRAATENLTGVTESVRSQIRDVNSVIEETTNRARLPDFQGRRSGYPRYQETGSHLPGCPGKHPDSHRGAVGADSRVVERAQRPVRPQAQPGE